jgi:hypothetical protein
MMFRERGTSRRTCESHAFRARFAWVLFWSCFGPVVHLRSVMILADYSSGSVLSFV